MDPAQINRNLISGESKLREQLGSSTVWQKYGVVVDSEGKDLAFVGCKDCHHVFNYKGCTTGTTTLTKHQCKVSTGQKLIISSVQQFALPTTKPSKDSCKTITAACVDWVCEDLRPFDVVEGTGFLHLIDTVSLNNSSIKLLEKG